MRRWLSTILILLFTILVGEAHAFQLPRGLSQSDRIEVVRTLGLNAATKMLDNPYPLGGYSGFEIGYSLEVVDVRDLSHLGCTPGAPGCGNSSVTDDSSWRYTRLTIGKGLYENVDVFFHFMTPAGGVQMSDYGGAIRWSFYQARFLPVNVSLLGHYDQLNFGNQFINRNLGAELMVGVNMDPFSIYFGAGEIEASGTFMGFDNTAENTVSPTDAAVDPNSNTVTNHITSVHTVVGLSFKHEDMFAAAEVDRYIEAVYSFKLGLRF